MKKTTKKKLPNWKKWAKHEFLPWYEQNPNAGIEPPAVSSKESWEQWGEEVYRPWYEDQPVQSQDDSGSNPGTPPPPPPGNP